jgi:hypothetical protein
MSKGRRIRMCYWKQWKKIRTRHKNMVKRGIDKSKAWEFANTRKGYWRAAGSPILTRTFINEEGLKETGVPINNDKVFIGVLILLNRRIPNGTYGGVRGRLPN